MNREDIRDRVADYLDRSDLTTRINNWINDVRRDIALKYNFNYLYAEATCTTSAGSARYALPEDYLGHLTIMLDDKKLMKVAPREFDELTGIDHDVTTTTGYLTYSEDTGDETSTPDYYVDRGMEIELYPAPDAAYTLKMRYYAQPEEWTDDANEDYVSRFHYEAMIWGVCLRGAMFLEEDNKIAIYAQAYQSAIDEMIKREHEQYQKPKDNFSRIKTWQDFDPTTFKRKVKVVTG